MAKMGYQGCVCSAWKHFQEIILHPCMCLAATENTVNRKSNTLWLENNHFWSVKSFTLWFYLQSVSEKHTQRERVRESESTHPKTERELEGKVKKTIDLVTGIRPTHRSHRRRLLQTHRPISLSLPPSDPPTDLATVTSFRPTHQSCRHQTHVTDLASTASKSNLPWPSSTNGPPPLDRTQAPLSLPSSLNLTEFDEFYLVWYYIFVWKMRKCEHQLENVFSIVFSRTQPNTKKYF